MSGKVYLVGCGPSAPDLLTLRAVKVLRKAEVVVYDRLVNPRVLKYATRAKKIYFGKKGGETHKQNEINKFLLREAKRGKTVVRLKNGDPMLFGRGGEELQYLRERRVEVEVIPGLPSATSLPSLAQVPLTQRGISSSLTILTGHRAKGLNFSPRGLGDTVVVLMGVGSLEEVVSKLVQGGKDASTPCMFIWNGSTPRERILITSLGKAVGAARRFGLAPPAVLVVGGVVQSKLSFRGKRVAVFKPSSGVTRIRELIKRSGGRPLVLEVCEVVPHGPRIKKYLGERWDAVVFTSPNSVRAVAGLVDLCTISAIAIGERTKQELRRFGCKQVELPEVWSSRGVEELIKKRGWKKVLALRSSSSRKKIRGATNVVAYSLRPKGVKRAIRNYLRTKVEITLLTSAGLLHLLLEAAEKLGLKREFIEKMNRTLVISIGESVTEFALSRGIWVNHELEKPSLESFVPRVSQ